MQDAPRVEWRFIVAVTLVVTCLFTIESMGWNAAPPFGIVHKRQAITWGIWLALTPAIIAMARRRPFGQGTRPQWLWSNLLLGGLFATASTAIAAALRALFGVSTSDAFGPATITSIGSNLAGDLLRYALIAGSYQAFAYYRTVREREALEARLRADLAEAKLANLEGRLHPHFLFNTLNSIAALVRKDPRAAETMVEQLSELLRASLMAHPLREVTLEEELRLTEQYLAIQGVRFRDRLCATLEASGTTRQARVPQLILQPLVENAVRHGIAPRESGGSITVTASVDRERLIMTVEDDGVGIGNAPAERAGTGLGLKSVESRLVHLYGTQQQFEVRPRSPSGTTVTITMPYRTAPA